MKSKYGLYIILALLFMSFPFAYAYFRSADSATNRFTIGYNEIEIKEVFNPPSELKAGISITKKVWCENTGTCDCYVRARVLFSDDAYKEYITTNYGNLSKWLLKEDGWFYYTDSIEAGESTDPLLESFDISDTATDVTFDDFNVIIYMESVQSGSFTDYVDAWTTFDKNRDN